MAAKRARREKYETMLAAWRQTRDFMTALAQQEAKERSAALARGETPKPPFFKPEDLDTAKEQVEIIEEKLAEAKADESKAAAALSESSSGSSDQSLPKGQADGDREPVAIPAGRTMDKEAVREAIHAAQESRPRSSTSASASSLSSSFSGVSSSAQRMASQLGEGGAKTAPEMARSPAPAMGALAGAPGSAAAGMYTSHPDSMRPIDPSRPVGTQDLAVAAISGFKDSFARQGLQVLRRPDGSVTIVDRSGRPATQTQLDALRRDIGSEPAALMRYPEFYSLISPEHFQGLKTRYRQDEGARSKEFKDVGLTEADRDFKWDKSCNKVSGECNRNAQQGSYKKDDFVPPKDLDSIWDEIEKEEKKQEEIAARRAQEELSQGAAASAEKEGLLDRIEGAMTGLWDSGAEAAAPGGEAGMAPDGGGSAAPARTQGGRGGRAEDRRSAGPAREHGARAARRTAPWKKWSLRAGMALGAGVLLFLGLRRRRSLREFFQDRPAGASGDR